MNTGTLIGKIVRREDISDESLIAALSEICEDEHYACNVKCPVFVKHEQNGGHTNGVCTCYKHGKTMLTYLRQ